MLDLLVVGHGLSGCWLSYYAAQAGLSLMVVDEAKPMTSSSIASGVINPVTGRRMVPTWMVEELLAFAEKAYAAMGAQCQTQLIAATPIVNFFAAPDMQQKFDALLAANNAYCAALPDADWVRQQFHYPFGIGLTQPTYCVDVTTMLQAQRLLLQAAGQWQNEQLDYGQLICSKDGIQYKGLEARKIVFCDGAAVQQNPFFKQLPFSYAKGEALLVRIPDLSPDYIYKKTLSIVSWRAAEQLFWVGSNYEWNYADEQPTAAFKENCLRQLKGWLQLPFSVEAHLAAVRPTTLERRPFVGFHPLQANVGILNGMGTKGCSLAPFFAHQLVNAIVGQAGISPEADVQRHQKLLMRT
jgi:glycine/D-amino acid oxidase-like deaminating enzyme